MAIKTLSIQGYRSIQNMRLTMDDINVIVGANGCGKSNLYKAVHLLAKAVNGELAETLALEGGMPSVLWAGSYLQPNAHILDIGCGSGHPIAAYLIEKGFQVTGIDGSQELLTDIPHPKADFS